MHDKKDSGGSSGTLSSEAGEVGSRPGSALPLGGPWDGHSPSVPHQCHGHTYSKLLSTEASLLGALLKHLASSFEEGFSTWALLTFGAGKSLFPECLMHFRMFSSIPAFYPLATPVTTTKPSQDFDKLPPVENHGYKGSARVERSPGTGSGWTGRTLGGSLHLSPGPQLPASCNGNQNSRPLRWGKKGGWWNPESHFKSGWTGCGQTHRQH